MVKPDVLQSMGSQRDGHNLVTEQQSTDGSLKMGSCFILAYAPAFDHQIQALKSEAEVGLLGVKMKEFALLLFFSSYKN